MKIIKMASGFEGTTDALDNLDIAKEDQEVSRSHFRKGSYRT